MRGDGGFGRDSGTTKRRMLPAVTDVVRELARTASADPAVLFKAARSVVADELAKVKQGFESAPLDVLVRRARRQLEQEGVVGPAPEGEAAEPKSVAIPAPPFKPKKPADEPFQSAAASDLDWEKRLDIQPDDAPFRSAILPLPPRSRAQGIALPHEAAPPAPRPPEPPRPPVPAQAPPSPASFSRLPEPDRVVAPEGLAVERSGAAPRPKPPVDDLPLFSSPTLELSSPLAPAPPPPPEAGEEAFVRPDPWIEATRESAPEPQPEPPREPAFTPRLESRFEPGSLGVEPPAPRDFAPRVEPPAPRPEPAVRSMSEMPPLAHLVGDVTEPVEPAMEEFAFKGPETAPPVRRTSRTGWLIAIAVVLAVGAGLLWAVRTFLSGDVVKRVEAPAPAPAPLAKKPAPSTQGAAPVAAPPMPVAAAEKPAPAKAAPAAAPVPKGKAAPLVTPDWTGKPVYVVHFSSHKDRPSAEKEARRLSKDLGQPGRAVEVDLGNKGTWYRAVIGEFATVEEARAYRADLEAKKTPGLGFVYEMRSR
jgi:hypothetical protein